MNLKKIFLIRKINSYDLPTITKNKYNIDKKKANSDKKIDGRKIVCGVK